MTKRTDSMTDTPADPEYWTVGAVSRLKVTDEELVPRLVFRIGGHAAAHDPERVGELIRHPAVHRVPNAPEVLAGLLNSRGRVVPVYDIRHLLPSTDSEPTDSGAIEWVLVFHDNDRDGDEGADDCVGVVIDEMPLRLRLLPTHNVSADSLPKLFQPWCRRIHEREQILHGELDMVGMLESIRGDAGAAGQEPRDHAEPERTPESPDDTRTGHPAAGFATAPMDAGWPHETDEDGGNK